MSGLSSAGRPAGWPLSRWAIVMTSGAVSQAGDGDARGVAHETPTRVRDVAVRTLRWRFETLWSELGAACADAHDAEAVHRLRVACRRTIAAIAAFRDLLPSRQRDWFSKRLRRLRRAAGTARDLDVLSARLTGRGGDAAAIAGAARHRLIAMLSRQRVGSRVPIREEMERLVAADWQAHVERFVEAAADARDGDETFAEYARRRFRRLGNRFFDHVDRRLHGDAEIHRLRIHVKKLRYALEIFAPVFPERVTAKCVKALERLQEHLGEFTDHAAAANRLRRWSRQDGVDAAQTAIVALRRIEEARADEARRTFVKWWTPGRRKGLRRRCERTSRRRSA